MANLKGGAYAATRGIKEVFPERLFNTPISETGFVGLAGGLASVGLRPVVEVMFPDFVLMASDQLFNQIGKLRHMFGGQVSFPTETMDYFVEYGKAKVVREGTDVTVLTYLTGVQKCLQVAEGLADEGISAEIIDLSPSSTTISSNGPRAMGFWRLAAENPSPRIASFMPAPAPSRCLRLRL